MRVEFAQPMLLLLIPILFVVSLLIYKKYSFHRILGNSHALWVLAARFLVITFTVLAIASPSILKASTQSATWVLLDVSDSTLTARGDMEAAVSKGLAAAPKDLSVGVIAFGADAMVEKPLAKEASFSHANTSVDPRRSDEDKALKLAEALLPSDSAGRMMLISDGQIADVTTQAALLLARGIAVDVMRISSAPKADAQVSKLTLPSKTYEGQDYQVTVTMDATADTHGTLILYANRQPVQKREVTLRKGENTIVFQDTAKAAGVVTYEAQLIADGDEQTRNNRMGAYMAVTGKPTVLLVEGLDDASRELRKLMDAAKMLYEVITPGRLPEDGQSLRRYDTVVLVNVDADDISQNALTALDSYVKVLGRGLVVIGGDRSYALGGYRGSKLEEMLPVTIDVRNQMDLPSLALVLVIDKSGSMTGAQFGATRLEVAKEAAMRSVEVLTSQDQVGVIAFDDAAKWVVPLGSAGDIAAVQQQIGTIRPGGGTAFYTPLAEALDSLTKTQAKLKHVIFLTDGEAGDNGYDVLVQRMADNGITMTTVAVGTGANVRVLSLLAQIGNGRSYSAGEFDNLPKIFTKETFLATGSYVQNRIFTPVITQNAQLTNYPGFPTLSGYLATTEKPLANIAMVSDRDDPILAWWQYGAGRVLAWTSDSQGAWTGRFLSWDQAVPFFTGLINHVLPDENQEGDLQVQVEGTQAKVRYTLPGGITAEESEQTTAYALLPDGTMAEAALIETEPNVYEGTFAADQQGAYAIRVEQVSGGQKVRQLEGGAVASYSQEYDLSRQYSTQALENLARMTGGRVIEDPAQMFAARGLTAETRLSLQTALLWAALGMFLIDIALRRLAFDQALVKAFTAARDKAEAAREEKREAAVTKKTEKPAKPSKKKDAPVAVSATGMADNLLKAREQKKHL